MSPGGDDRYRASRRGDRQRYGGTNSDDHVRVPADHLTGEVGKALRLPLARIALDGEVLPLDIAQPPQLCKELLPGAGSVLADAGDRTRGDNDRDPALPRQLLRPCRSSGGSEQQTNREVTALHSMTSSARPRTDGGIVRPS